MGLDLELRCGDMVRRFRMADAALAALVPLREAEPEAAAILFDTSGFGEKGSAKRTAMYEAARKLLTSAQKPGGLPATYQFRAQLIPGYEPEWNTGALGISIDGKPHLAVATTGECYLAPLGKGASGGVSILEKIDLRGNESFNCDQYGRVEIRARTRGNSVCRTLREIAEFLETSTADDVVKILG